jgi:hypothetical protein
MLDRLQCSSESWLDLVKNFRKRFRVEIGLASTLQSVSSRRRSHRLTSLNVVGVIRSVTFEQTQAILMQVNVRRFACVSA